MGAIRRQHHLLVFTGVRYVIFCIDSVNEIGANLCLYRVPEGTLGEDSTLRLIAMLQDTGLQNLQERWSSWRADGEIPLRVSFDPIDFPRQISLMQLGEIVPQPNALRAYDVVLRYLGTGWVDLFNAGQLTNTRVSELGPVYGERWFNVHDKVIAARQPLMIGGSPYGIDKEFLDFEILGLPLSKTGRDVDYVLLALAMVSPEA